MVSDHVRPTGSRSAIFAFRSFKGIVSETRNEAVDAIVLGESKLGRFRFNLERHPGAMKSVQNAMDFEWRSAFIRNIDTQLGQQKRCDYFFLLKTEQGTNRFVWNKIWNPSGKRKKSCRFRRNHSIIKSEVVVPNFMSSFS